MYDCIIIGAGPGGGSAAYHLAKRGRSVLLLEKASLPRYKPCGGGVAPQVAEWFDFDFSPAISLKVNSIRYTWNMDDPVEVNLDPMQSIWMVRRDVFDHFLVQQAQRQGAELCDNTEVTGIEWQSDRWQVNTPNGPVTGRYLVAADGARGSMAKWLGFENRKRHLAGALEIEADAQVNPREPVHFEFGMVKNGYIWNFPKADGYSIGVGTFRGGERQDFKAIVAEYSKLFDVDLNQARQFGHPLTVWDGNQDLHTQNAVLVGEAACVVDPMTAEGIRPSMFTGVKAAEAIDAALGGVTDALATYTQTIQEEWGSEMLWAQRLAAAFYRFPGIGYKLGIKRPSASKKMIQIASGKLRYQDVADRALKKLSGGLL
ncbi:geranylgeranyl reductase family protein [Leptolyngbya sp. AN02str]|uniref:geranylgeranyl reductase family protein n=1 Tax=Leptolyngbya sp. AN02str TaxID=3423363 RepID=UPI003D31EB38